MTSNLAVIEAKIIDVLPYQERTPSNLTWVRENLADPTNTPDDVIAKLNEFFGVTYADIAYCKSQIQKEGIRLDTHILDTARNFESVRNELRELQTEVRINKAVSAANQLNQQAFNKNFSDGINSAHQSATHAAGNKGWGWTGDPTATFFLVLFMGIVGFGWISSLANTRPASVQSAPQERPVMRGY